MKFEYLVVEYENSVSREDLEGIRNLYERECGEKLDVLNPEPLINFIKKKEELFPNGSKTLRESRAI